MQASVSENHHLGFKAIPYKYVLLAMAAGCLTGYLFPLAGNYLKPLADAFISLIKMVTPPVVFLTVCKGLASSGGNKEIGKISLKALVYFEVVSTLALLIGWGVALWLQPGSGIAADPKHLDGSLLTDILGKQEGNSSLLKTIIPTGLAEPFLKGSLLQALVLAILAGLSLRALPDDKKTTINKGLNTLSEWLFASLSLIMWLAPFAAFASMAYTIGKFGADIIGDLGYLLLLVYLSCAIFIGVVLGGISKMYGLSIVQIIRHIKEEIYLVFATSSSESALPGLMKKAEKAGVSSSVSGLVIPAGYSFNLDGTSIYLSMALMFIANACGIHLSLEEQLAYMAILLITSKGAAAVTGGGLITLAATLSLRTEVPVTGLILVLGVDRLMSEARAVTNLIGNAVATMVIAKSKGDEVQLP